MSTTFRTAWRSITRNPRYFALHIIGLGMAIACGLVIYQYITFHLSYDKYHRKAEQTYKLVSDILLETTARNEGASYAIYEALKTKVAGVEQTAFAMANQQLTFRVNGHLFESDGKAAFAGPDWFDLFDFQWLAGQPEALGEPHTMVLRASTAVRFFGSEDPMGKTIEVAGVPLTVVGILADEPTNTSLKSTCYISAASITSILRDIDDGFFSYWGYLNSSNQGDVSLAPGTGTAQVEETLQDMTMDAFGEDAGKLFKFSLLPLADIHFDEHYGGTMRKSLLTILAAVGVAILLMALLNYVNLSIAQYARRSAEFGTRKVLGGSRWQLFAQSMAETFTVAAWAAGFGICVAAVAIPLANNHLFPTEPIPQFSVQQFIAVAVVAWLTISIAAGVYPAWVIGNLQALRAMRQQLGLGHPMGRKFMVIVQHALSFCLIVATIVIMGQVHYLQHTDIGFDRESVLMLPLPKGHEHDGRWRTFLDTQPTVASYSYCFRSPANHDQRGSTLRFANRPEWETWSAKTTFADSAYLQTFGIRLIAGRNIRTAATTREYVVNELMAQQLGADNPGDVLGKPLLFGGIDDEPGTIVGVVANYNIHALSQAIEPTVLGYSEPFMQSLAIKVAARDMQPFIDELEHEWKARYPDVPFHFQFVDDQIEQLYVAESTQQQLIWIASGLAIVISCLGLFGLTALSVQRRTKEIGIRKVLGASVAGIAALLSSDLMKLIAVAIAVASPLAWWSMNKWLENFAYRIDIQWWMFVVAGLVAVVIALLTVSWQAIRAALANPVDSLRDE